MKFAYLKRSQAIQTYVRVAVNMINDRRTGITILCWKLLTEIGSENLRKCVLQPINYPTSDCCSTLENQFLFPEIITLLKFQCSINQDFEYFFRTP